MFHWCNQETEMLVEGIRFAGYYFAQVSSWFHSVFPHNHKKCGHHKTDPLAEQLVEVLKFEVNEDV